jgi:cytochrome P450
MLYAGASRDPRVVEDPKKIDITRETVLHSAFGVGIHRCIGSNLARMELRVAIEEWLARIPRFDLVKGAHVEWNGGQVRGPRTVPITIG